MAHTYAQTLFTPAVRNQQSDHGSRAAYERFDDGPPTNNHLGDDEIAFIERRDSMYMASTSTSGWPYLQHRGGAPGFVRVVDGGTLAFANFRGNRQYITAGNLDNDDRVSLFFMDYVARRRLKLLGHAHVSDQSALIEAVTVPGYRGRIESAIVIRVHAFAWNCPQHITPRFTEAEIAEQMSELPV